MSMENLTPREIDPVVAVKSPAEERGKQVWDGYIGGVMTRNRTLLKLVKILAFACVLLAGALVYKSMELTTVPYVIEVDKTNGDIRIVGDVRNNKYNPDDNVMKAYLRKFIIDTRGLTSDPNVYTERLEEGYNMLTKKSQERLKAYYESSNRKEMFGKITIQIKISSVLSKGSNIYQVNWQEDEIDVTGRKNTVYMTGIFTLANIPVDDDELKRINPLGIFITDFSWDRDDTVKNSDKTNNADMQIQQ